MLKESLEKSSEQKNELTLEQQVWEQLALCYDPEIPVNIVDLGLIYGVSIEALPDGKNIANIKMTLTSPGCSMANYIIEDMKCRVASIPTISDVRVEVVFDPPWDKSMISMEAKLTLGII